MGVDGWMGGFVTGATHPLLPNPHLMTLGISKDLVDLKYRSNQVENRAKAVNSHAC